MDTIEKFSDSLVMLDLFEKDNISLLIEETRNQIQAEIENNIDFKPLDCKVKMILMNNIIKILEKLKERYEYLLYNYNEIEIDNTEN